MINFACSKGPKRSSIAWIFVTFTPQVLSEKVTGICKIFFSCLGPKGARLSAKLLASVCPEYADNFFCLQKLF